jgi:glycosyltransferase involved in cell wall biosynthesis
VKVLVISNSEWDDSASFGNTFTNIFGGVKDVQLANIFCREGTPDTKVCSQFLKISERTILSAEPARVVSSCPKGNEPVQSGPPSFFKKHRWTVFFWAREMIWATKRWKCKALDDFVQDFAPDVILLMIYPYSYINKLALHIANKFNVPMITHVSDDDYSLKQRSWSPLYWINRLYQRRWIKKAVGVSRALYCMTEMQKEEYAKYFRTPTKLLVKGVCASAEPDAKAPGTPRKFLYAGNLGDGRWKTVLKIGQAIDKVVADGQAAHLDVFTPTPLSKGAIKAFARLNNTTLSGKIPYAEVVQRQADADVLIHVESFVKKFALRVRHSFSTKIVDCFARKRCVLAVGPKDVASMDYLIRHDSAVVVTDVKELEGAISRLVKNDNDVALYAQKGFECGRKLHDIKRIQSEFVKDIKELV